MKELIRKSIYFIASAAETAFSIGEPEKQPDKHEKFTDGVGLYNVSGNVMTKEELKAEEYETGLYDDY